MEHDTRRSALCQASLCYGQVEKLKDENNSLMEELVAKKMALAELSENHARLKRDLHRRAERDKACHFAIACVVALSRSLLVIADTLCKAAVALRTVTHCAWYAQRPLVDANVPVHLQHSRVEAPAHCPYML